MPSAQEFDNNPKGFSMMKGWGMAGSVDASPAPTFAGLVPGEVCRLQTVLSELHDLFVDHSQPIDCSRKEAACELYHAAHVPAPPPLLLGHLHQAKNLRVVRT